MLQYKGGVHFFSGCLVFCPGDLGHVCSIHCQEQTANHHLLLEQEQSGRIPKGPAQHLQQHTNHLKVPAEIDLQPAQLDNTRCQWGSW